MNLAKVGLQLEPLCGRESAGEIPSQRGTSQILVEAVGLEQTSMLRLIAKKRAMLPARLLT